MFNKIKQLKHLRDQASQIKQMLSQETVKAQAAGGKINMVMDGNQELLAIDIAPELLTPNKKEELEKAVKEATNEAIKKAQCLMAQKMQSMGGLNIPGLT